MTSLPPTEQRNPRSSALSTMAPAAVVALMNDEEKQALRATRDAAPQISAAADAVARAFMAEGRILLFGSGTSGRLAFGEVSELPPTFGVDRHRFVAFGAGGPTLGQAAITRSEDDTEAGPSKLAELGLTERDAVIGIAASGTTPFVLATIDAAREAGAWTCGVANNPGTPLLRRPHLGILLDTGPEVLTGSTRLKAGTAQKVALNQITTAAMVLCGRVIENHMVDVRPTLEKLRLRAVRIMCDLRPR